MLNRHVLLCRLAFAAVLLTLLLTGCAEDQPARFVLAENRVPMSAVTIIASDKGFFEDEGLYVIVRNFASGKLCLDAVVAGSADFATVAETPLMRAGLAGQKVKIVATFEYSDNDIKVLGPQRKKNRYIVWNQCGVLHHRVSASLRTGNV